MPSEREFEKRIPALYRRKTMDVFMFGYVSGIIDTLDSVSIKQAITIFLYRHNISEDDFNFDTAIQCYYKIRDDIKDIGI